MEPQEPTPVYRAYLLRFWRDSREAADGEQVWRFSLDDPQTGERRGFGSLQQVVAHLTAQMGAVGLVSPHDTGGDRNQDYHENW